MNIHSPHVSGKNCPSHIPHAEHEVHELHLFFHIKYYSRRKWFIMDFISSVEISTPLIQVRIS